jgi:DNA-binding helix-hairpin-helix protein with protein kinase domain
MSQALFDQDGNRITIGPKLGSGGEGDVFEIANTSAGCVAKLYKHSIPEKKKEKLLCMTRVANPLLSNIAAWPAKTILSESNDVVGIIMPKVTGKRPIHELYTPSHRNSFFPHADWQFLVRVATNCAGAFDTLHSSGIVVGDVNQGNILVGNDAVVTFIDCDSFQLSNGITSYRCEVGVPHFTPPELQSVPLSSIDRTKNHDAFGMAVMIFHLLFMGRHPYSGIYLGSEYMPIEQSIREGRFAFGAQAERNRMRPPPNSLRLTDLTPGVASLFEQAFQTSSRPSAKAWWTALTELEKQLQKCVVPGHVFCRSRQSCPWCLIEKKGGPNLFISVAIKAIGNKSGALDVDGAWRDIVAIKPPRDRVQEPHPIGVGPVPGTPFPAELVVQNGIAFVLGGISLTSIVLLCIVSAIQRLGVGGLFWSIATLSLVMISIVFGVWCAILHLTAPISREMSRRRKRVTACEAEVRNLEKELTVSMQSHQDRFELKLKELRQRCDAIRSISSQHAAAMDKLRQDVREQQRTEYLRQAFISDANISGIGQNRTLTLEAYGFETAFDVLQGGVDRIPGFGDMLTANLMAWAASVDGCFRFDASRGLPAQATQALDVAFYQRRLEHERALKRGPAELELIGQRAVADSAAIAGRLSPALVRLAQAKADVSVAVKHLTRR